MSRVLLMADSTCDLPAEWVRQFDVRIVPTYVQFDIESLADDGVELTRAGFYERLASSSVQPTTAAPPLGLTIDIMARALNDADHVIALTAPAKLSGLHNIFRLAAERTDPSRVTVIDARMVTMGMGWQVMMALDMIEAGLSPAEIKQALIRRQPDADVWAALDTLEYLKRSGRVGWASALMGDLFHIKPIIRLHLDVVSSVSRVRTPQRAFQALIDLAHESAPFERLAVLHTSNLEGAMRLADALVDVRPKTEYAFTIVEATPVLGVHVGPNGLGLGVVRKTQS